MRKLLVLLAAFIVVVEVFTPPLVERALEQRVRDNAGGVAAVIADVDSFPMVTRLLATGELRRVTVTLSRVVGFQLPLATLDIELVGVEVDRGALLSGELEVREIDRGLVVAEITGTALSEELGIEVRPRSEGLRLVVAGSEVDATVEGGEGTLRITGGQVSVAVDLHPEVLPCAPDVVSAEGRLLVSCELREVPTLLVRGATLGR